MSMMQVFLFHNVCSHLSVM